MLAVQRTGDAVAFAALAEEWQPRLHLLAERLTGDRQAAADICQESLSRIYLYRNSWDASRPFGAWARQIAVNLCRDHLRRAAVRREQELRPDCAHADETPGPDACAAAGDDADRVRQAVAALPEELREPLVLRHYEDLKAREIAAVLSIPEGTVYWRIAEAHARLRMALAPILDRASTTPAIRTAASLPHAPSSIPDPS